MTESVHPLPEDEDDVVVEPDGPEPAEDPAASVEDFEPDDPDPEAMVDEIADPSRPGQ